MKRLNLTALFALACSPALAETPLGAIDWLKDPAPISVAQPLLKPLGQPQSGTGATVPDVEVMPLDTAKPDAVGLLPSATTGLPPTLWQASTTDTLTSLFARISPDPLPAIQALYYTLLLAEAEPPADAGPDARFLKARLDALHDLGAVEPALALAERAGPSQEPLFDQWFDLALLNGNEDAACAALADNPRLTDRFEARIFCGARMGDWQTAALTYETARAVGALAPPLDSMLAQYLDPETIEGAEQLAPSSRMTPLLFRLHEANGAPLPTRNLPRAYAVTDLRGVSGWRAELEAAERLAHTGALPANRLLGLYTQQSPAASGGIWDRVARVQALEAAIADQDTDAVETVLIPLWSDMKREGLAVVLSALYAAPLAEMDLTGQAGRIAFDMALLSPNYEVLAAEFRPEGRRAAFLAGLAQGNPDPELARSVAEQAIATAFATQDASTAQADLLKNGRLGQAILSAALQLDSATPNQGPDIIAGLSTLRAVGLEDTARRAALQILLLRAGA
ncbi:hypothetical protein [Roseovarius aestuariivivens]|uniref:hypothetical protein n=1 Tax=Roseovarius aestuariivivens TaxID=1888910 RepID=UPI001081E86E|nr:hypothetical protein [Roseovarius aestuariivivens]